MIRIERIEIGYAADDGDGPERKRVTLTGLREHCRPERVTDLLEDLELLVEDVEAGRRPGDRGRPALSVVRRPT